MASPPFSADEPNRNLLFGILALQNNFIDRDALLGAFAAWVVDKGRPLGEILCQQGKLTQLQDELLRALTQQHIQQHGNDPEKSLAVVSSVGSIRDDLRKLHDPQLEASLAAVAQHGPALDPYATNLPSTTDWKGGDGLRFRVLRPHAKGGLGEVFVAQDLELHREVALKEIQSRFADQPNSRSRFVVEAEITGGLEHPGIVPVYGLGQYADGRPFYAMRFIRGDSLKDAIERFHKADEPGREPGERTLELRKLLGRFIDVCEAIEYAHSRGILHRDLKPGNIMLGKYGETLVVDWGLAKAVGRGERTSDTGETTLQPSSGDSVDPTLMGKAIGTPAYMSPEQAAGRLSEFGPASDVYSLGATLYCLLTGQPPFSGKDHGAILRQVQKGEFPRPREIKPKAPAALEAICQKAMSLNSMDRYPSPKMLADDIEHWLADEPVACYPEPAMMRARRWVKRHPTLVVCTAATVLISLTSLAVIATVVGQSNRTLAAKNTELEQANQRERKSTSLAQKNATVAREQTQLALQSLESVIFDIQRKLDNVPGAGDLKRTLLQTALARLQEVSDQFASRGAIDRSTMVALLDLGDVFLRIGSSSPRPGTPGRGAGGEGSAGDESEGPLAGACKVYQQAFDIAQKLAAADPSDAQAQRDLSAAYMRLGDVQLRSGQVTEALGASQKAIEIDQKLAAADPSDVLAQRSLSASYSNLGNVHLQSGQVTEALGAYQKAIEIVEKLAAADPSDALAQSILSASYSNLGNVHLQSGQVTEALGASQKAIEINQKLAVADPSDALAQRSLSDSYSSLGNVHLRSGQVTEARGSYQKAIEIDQKLAAADPSDTMAQRSLFVSYIKLGDMHLESEEVTESLVYYQQGLEIIRKLAAADPSDALAQRSLSDSYDKLGDVQLQSGQVTEALGSFQQGLEIRQKLAAADPSDAQAQRDLAVSFENLGRIALLRGELTTARDYFTKELRMAEVRMKLDPKDAGAQRFTFVVYGFLGDAQLQSGQVTEAMGSYQKGLEISQKLAAADPSDARAQIDLVASHHRIGSVQQKQKQYEQAIESYRHGMKALQSLKEQKRLAPVNEKMIPSLEQLMKQCKLAPMALGDWKTLLEQPADVLPVLLEMRGTQFVQEGRAGDAVQAVAKLRELGTATAEQLYNAACVYSLCAAGIKAEKDELTAEQAAERKKHIADALETLREAIRAGYKNFAHMQKDPDLNLLRGLPEFQALLPK